MSAASMSSPLRWLLRGALVVGLLDGLDAVIVFHLRGVSPVRLFQGIARNLIGASALEGGAATALLGVAVHFLIAATIVTVAWLILRRAPALGARLWLAGPLYGVAVWLTMNRLVIPYLGVGNGPPKWPQGVMLANGILIHILGVGIPAVWFARKAAASRG